MFFVNKDILYRSTLKISQCTHDYNLKMKLHADEFNDSVFSVLIEIAVSADHLMKSMN